ncbi:MAG: AAA family ATPase [Gemmatimonas sp.]
MHTTTLNNVLCPVLVGRQSSLSDARTALMRAQNARGGFVLIAGEAGVGKSRFLRELAGQARQLGFALLNGACFETDRSIPYAPLLDLVRAFASSSSNAVAAHTFAAAEVELVRAFPELVTVFGEGTPAAPLDPHHERRLLFHAITTAFDALANTQPVLITIEDLQWADEATIELLAFLARNVGTQRITFALTYRDDEIHPPLRQLLVDLDRARLATEIALTQFSLAELTIMLNAIFNGSAPAAGFVEQLHRITDGNPFFAEEVLKSLVASGELSRRENGVWREISLSTVKPPRTAVEAVRRRLAALSVAARDVASIAAVAGRRFDFRCLQALTNHDEPALLDHIRELMEAQLVIEESPDRFAFRHALTREALLGELLTRERAALHRRVADELQRTHGDSDATIAALAYHAYGAMDWRRAYETSRAAANRALSLHAPREALMHMDRAVDSARRAGLAPDATMHFERGQACEVIGDMRAANENFLAALASARIAVAPADECDALYALGKLWAARDYARAGEYRRDALRMARSINDPSRIARCLNLVANWHVNVEQPALALRDQHEALTLFEQLGDRRGIAETVDLLAMTHYIAGNLREAAARFEHAARLHRTLEDPRGEANALGLLVICNTSNHASAATFASSSTVLLQNAGDRALHLARSIDWRAGEMFLQYVIADSASWTGDYDRALRLSREALANAEALRHLQWECGAACTMGSLLHDLESPARARELLERAHSIAKRIGSRTWTRWSAAAVAITLSKFGEFQSAHALLDDAAGEQIALTQPDAHLQETPFSGDWTLGLLHLRLARAEVVMVEGDAAGALSIANEHIAAEAGPVPRWTFVKARALLMLDQLDDAELLVQQTIRDAEQTGARPLLWRVHAVHGALLLKRRQRLEARQAFGRARRIAGDLAQVIDDTELRAEFLRGVSRHAPAAPIPTQQQKVKESFGGLTARERDVARLIAEGKANRAIARTLSIGERTVEGYVSGALAKLGMTTRSQLAAWTVERGLGGTSVIAKQNVQ